MISGEEFSASPPGVIRKIISDLGAQRLHVVITLRPLDKVLLSQWQQDIRSAWTYLKFEPWLKATLRDARDQYRIGPLSIRHRFWYRHRHDELIKRWAALVGKERVHIVIVRDYDLDFLYHSFESLLELKSSTLVSNSERQHQSLGADQIEVFRRVVRLLHRTVAGQALLSSKRLPLNEANEAVEQVMPAQGQRVQIEIPAWAVSNIQTISEDIREAVMSGGYNVIGSSVDLAPSKAAASTSQRPRFSEGELNRFAIQAYNLLLMREPFTPIREASWLTFRAFQLLRFARIGGRRITAMLKK